MPRLKELKVDPAWSLRTLRRKENEAAREVCWALLIAMELGAFEIPQESKPLIEKQIKEWSDLCFTIEEREKKQATP